jgi:nicotinate-nucleotide pyrophosphorylase (carboxylating)
MLFPELAALVRRALREDIGSGDITTSCTVPARATGRGRIVAKESFILAGIEVGKQTFRTVNRELNFFQWLEDGSRTTEGDCLLEVVGDMAAILMAERTALNFLQRLSGIATITRSFVDKVAGTQAQILDTRKTTPGHRFLEKGAVRAGGGRNHRFGLYDGILIKDNHIAAAGSIRKAVKAARQNSPHMLKVEVEVESLNQLMEAVAAGADIAMLDNMDLVMMAEAVKRTEGKIPLEASGGITLDNVRDVAATGVDFISVGALTHSARAVDMSLEIET